MAEPIWKKRQGRKPYWALTPSRRYQIAREAKKEFLQYIHNETKRTLAEKKLRDDISSTCESVKKTHLNTHALAGEDGKRQNFFDFSTPANESVENVQSKHEINQGRSEKGQHR